MRVSAHKRLLNTPKIEKALEEDKIDPFNVNCHTQGQFSPRSKLGTVTLKSRYHVSQTFSSSRKRSITVLVSILAISLSILVIWMCYFIQGYTPVMINSKEVTNHTEDHSPLVLRLGSNDENFDHNLKTEKDSIKYLAYLPHSGFHNQRIALENALVMSRILNRTLLVPPVRLGRTLTYYPFDHLFDLISLSGKEGLSHCIYDSSWETLPIECSDYYEYTLVPWGWLSNTSSLFSVQPVIQRWDMSPSYVQHALGIADNDTFFVKDEGPYDYRFVDADPLDMPGARFKEVISMALLSQLPHRLIHVGTLFGSSRLRLRRSQNLAFRKEVRQSMTFSNELFDKLSKTIGMGMGEKYLSVHIRLGDGNFEKKGEKNVRLIWWKLLTDILGFDDSTTLKLENRATGHNFSSPPLISHKETNTKVIDVPKVSFPVVISSQLTCQKHQYSDTGLSLLNIPLYISTDVSDPRAHPLLKRFYATFPCSFTLNDFTQEKEFLSRLRSDYDWLPMKDFLIPFVDAVVAGKSLGVVGTEGSTFSQFVQDVLWRQYHGWEIEERG